MTQRENFIRFFNNEPVEWMPSRNDIQFFSPDIIPDNVARGTVSSDIPYSDEMYGGKDFFGIPWVFQPKERGSMEERGFRLVEDIADWEEQITFPNLDALDWEGCAKRSAKFIHTDKLISAPIYSGFFERLISFVGFEDAAIAMIDEEQSESVKALFKKLAEFYGALIKRLHVQFNVEHIFFHDDWGTQISTFFSPAVYQEMIAPYIRQVAQYAHENGVYMEMHSCGMIAPLIPNLIETGVDTWVGQSGINDKFALVNKYGDQFKFGVNILGYGHPLSQDEIDELALDFVNKYRDKKVWFGVSPDVDKADAHKLIEKVYVLLKQNSS